MHQPVPAGETDRYGSLPSFGGTQAGSNLDPYRHVKDSLKDILYHDNSDVSMEQQVNEIVKNQTEHNLAIDIMAAQLRLLRPRSPKNLLSHSSSRASSH